MEVPAVSADPLWQQTNKKKRRNRLWRVRERRKQGEPKENPFFPQTALDEIHAPPAQPALGGGSGVGADVALLASAPRGPGAPHGAGAGQ